MQLLPQDFVSPYYRDDSILLGVGLTPYELMLQLLAKKDDPFSGGRTYYSHPSLRRDDFPKMIHQSSGTGMQAIPTTGIAMGMKYKEEIGIDDNLEQKPIAVCSLGDASCTEGEVSEAFQMAALNNCQFFILFRITNGIFLPTPKKSVHRILQNICEVSTASKPEPSTEQILSNLTKPSKNVSESFVKNAGQC
jgi:TPP-dependent pyruvate/acetoin dehydrogenase alpha subunit